MLRAFMHKFDTHYEIDRRFINNISNDHPNYLIQYYFIKLFY